MRGRPGLSNDDLTYIAILTGPGATTLTKSSLEWSDRLPFSRMSHPAYEESVRT